MADEEFVVAPGGQAARPQPGSGWTANLLDEALAEGPIPNIGQITPELKKHLQRRIHAGEVFSYRGFWDTCSPDFGMGPPKTIYALTAHAGATIVRERQSGRRIMLVPRIAQ